MGLIADCELYFGTKSLYEVLYLEKTASATQLKKAYKKASLLCHPDKVDESRKDEATRKFQVLSKVYFVLTDTEKRSFFDETGLVDDENSLAVDASSPDFWKNFFNTVFPKLSVHQINEHLKKYRGSEEEKQDLIKEYNKYEGDFDKISQCFIGYELEEEERIFGILHDLIKENKIPSFPQFVNESAAKKRKRHKKEKRMRVQAAADIEEMAASDELLMSALAKRSEERKSDFDGMISSLEAKYGKKDSGQKKKKG